MWTLELDRKITLTNKTTKQQQTRNITKNIQILNNSYLIFLSYENYSRVQDYTFKELLEGGPANVLGK